MSAVKAQAAITRDPWSASPDCGSCPERASAIAEVGKVYDDQRDQAIAAGSIGYCMRGMLPAPERCGRECPVGKDVFMKLAATAVAGSHQQRVTVRLSEEV